MSCMDGIISNSTVNLTNLTNLKTNINRIRTKHKLSSLSWSSIPDNSYVKASHVNEIGTNLKRFTESKYVSSVNGVPTVNVGDYINKQTLKVMDSKLKEIDNICVHDSDNTSHRAANYSSDYTSHRASNYSSDDNSDNNSDHADHGSYDGTHRSSDKSHDSSDNSDDRNYYGAVDSSTDGSGWETPWGCTPN